MLDYKKYDIIKGYRLKDRVIRPASVKVNKIEK